MHSSSHHMTEIFEGLLALLDPDVVFRPDRAAVQMGGTAEIRGARRQAGRGR
jgi:hypothetical protein